MWIHSNCCKGVISLVGKGGAIRVQHGSAVLVDCYFEDNTASLLGGAIFVDLVGRLTMDNVTLVVDAVSRHAVDGDLVYSNGNVTVESARLIARSASDHVSVLCHSGTRWSFEAASIEVYCPVCVTTSRVFALSVIRTVISLLLHPAVVLLSPIVLMFAISETFILLSVLLLLCIYNVHHLGLYCILFSRFLISKINVALQLRKLRLKKVTTTSQSSVDWTEIC